MATKNIIYDDQGEAKTNEEEICFFFVSKKNSERKFYLFHTGNFSSTPSNLT